ncbi:GGDEF domain-containing protein [Leeia oryzae]|uniref:GGDEF domain-containing protein n=1 Tax=Leeia oryzae TaxID=356662 RepID=UPI0003761AE3|nr:GGDEF domain-containing protein [Leeia oryzae]
MNTIDSRTVISKFLTILVAIIMVVTGWALWLADKEGTSLSTPQQHDELWQMYSVGNQLEQIRHLATQFISNKTGREQLTRGLADSLVLIEKTRSDFLASGALTNRDNPVVFKGLDVLSSTIKTWLLRTQSHNDRAPMLLLASDILKEHEANHEQLLAMMTDIHRTMSAHLDQDRLSLKNRFTSVRWVLYSCFVFSILLFLKLLLDIRFFRKINIYLSELNERLKNDINVKTSELRNERQLLLEVIEASPCEVVLFTEATGKILLINKRFSRRLCLTDVNQPFMVSDLVFDPKKAKELIVDLDTHGAVDDWEGMISVRSPYWSSLSARKILIDNQKAYLFWSFDLSVHKNLQDKLQLLANTDMLSGIYNRRAFMQKADLIIKTAGSCGLLMLDIDNFKHINDTYGHAAGDTVIVGFGELLKSLNINNALYGRLGGEEFAVLLPYISQERLLAQAEEFRMLFAEYDFVCDEDVIIHATVSIGAVHTSSMTERNISALLSVADKALYVAKTTGKNKVVPG